MEVFWDQVFSNGRSQNGSAISWSRIRSFARSLQLDFDSTAIWCFDLTKRNGSSIAELTRPRSELMSSVTLGDTGVTWWSDGCILIKIEPGMDFDPLMISTNSRTLVSSIWISSDRASSVLTWISWSSVPWLVWMSDELLMLPERRWFHKWIMSSNARSNLVGCNCICHHFAFEGIHKVEMWHRFRICNVGCLKIGEHVSHSVVESWFWSRITTACAISTWSLIADTRWLAIANAITLEAESSRYTGDILGWSSIKSI